MLLNTNNQSIIDSIEINFDTEALWLLNTALAIIMFGVALDIHINDFKRLFETPKLFLVGILAQFIVLPALTFVAVFLLKPHPSFALGMILVAACPGGNVSNFFSKMAGGNAALSVSLTAFATLLSIILTPVNLQFWGNLYTPTQVILKAVTLDFMELLKLVLLILGVPLVLGMLLNHFHRFFAQKINKILRPTSVLFFITLIIIALYENLFVFKSYVHLVLFLVIFHNILAYFLGYSTARFFKLNKKEVITITIETGIQNSGLGLLLIFSFFNGLGGMALLAAFWGIWDIFSGMLLATYLRRIE